MENATAAPSQSISKSFLSLFLVIFLLLVMPVGVFLALNRTSFMPRAATTLPSQSETGFTLSQDLSPSLKLQNGEIAVSILTKTEIDEANLFATKINFPAETLKVKGFSSQRSGNYFVSDWIEQSFDNNSGTISLIGGVANPGFKSSPEREAILTTIIFEVKERGEADINISEAQIFRNSDNADILSVKTPVNLIGSEVAQTSSSSAELQRENNAREFLTLIETEKEALNYLEPVRIRWNSAGIERVSVLLYLNDQLFGILANEIEETSEFTFNPVNSIQPIYVSSANTFQVEVKGSTRTGTQLSDKSTVPFYFTLGANMQDSSTSAVLKKSSADLSSDNRVTLQDLSVLLSGMGGNNEKLDLNGDGVINNIDILVIKNLLKSSGQI